MKTRSAHPRSRWWYLVPIFAGIIGGCIAWYALKKNDKHLAKNCLILGIVLEAVELLTFTGILISFENFSLITNLDGLFEARDFDLQFQIASP